MGAFISTTGASYGKVGRQENQRMLADFYDRNLSLALNGRSEPDLMRRDARRSPFLDRDAAQEVKPFLVSCR